MIKNKNKVRKEYKNKIEIEAFKLEAKKSEDLIRMPKNT